MRIILVTFCSLIACLIIFWTIKFWGQAQRFVAYNHPLYESAKTQAGPIVFVKPLPKDLETELSSSANLYLNVASTADQRTVLPKVEWTPQRKAIRYSLFEEIKSDVILLADVKEKLTGKKIIFNLVENAQAGHVIFYDELKKMGWEKGEFIIMTSPYEAMAKALKDIAPALLYGSTQPEILRLVAMNSMYLVEAVTMRADIVIHPLKIKNRTFFEPRLLQELSRRQTRIIVGPLAASDLKEAKQLNPFGIIVENRIP